MIAGDIYAPYQETDDHMVFLLKVPLADADLIDRKRIEIRVLGPAPTSDDTPADKSAAGEEDEL